MDITPDKKKILDLVDQANVGSICLPRFQRDFVWARDEVADLLRSLLRGYFVGSLLLLRCDPDAPPFAPTPIRGANPPATLRPDLLVLDGQQRMTSLLYALSAPNLGLKNSKTPRRFYVDLDLLAADPDSDEIVLDLTDREARLEGLDSREGQWTRHIIPFKDLKDDKTYNDWLFGISDWLHDNNPAAFEEFKAVLRGRWTAAVAQLQGFEVPVVYLPIVKEGDADAIARVCAIFEKLNSTGVALSVYDLLTARLFRHSIDLHALWEEAVSSHGLLNEWSEGSADSNKFGVLILRTMALMRDLEPKPKILINLEPKQFEEDWRRAVDAMERALTLLSDVGVDGFGAFDRKWFRVYGLLPVFAALRARIEDHHLGDEPRRDLRRWYWSSVFLERYSSAVESKSRRDYLELCRRWNGEAVNPVVFSDAQTRLGAEGYGVRESTSYASSIYSGVFCLLVLHGARDWAAAEAINLQSLQDHHIFPKGYLNRKGFDPRKDASLINSIVNRTLISDATNNKIKDKAPHDYLQDSSVFARPAAELLPEHFVSEGEIEDLKYASEDLSPAEVREIYEKFAAGRESLIVTEIRRVCGIGTKSSPPMAVDEVVE